MNIMLLIILSEVSGDKVFVFCVLPPSHLIRPGERGLYKMPVPRLEVRRQHWDMRRGGSHQNETNCDGNYDDR